MLNAGGELPDARPSHKILSSAELMRLASDDLVEIGEEREIYGARMFGIASAGAFFPMMPADNLKDFK